MFRFKNKNITTYLLLIVVFSLEKFAYLIPTQKYFIPGLMKYSDFGIILALLWILWVFFNCCKKKSNLDLKRKNKKIFKNIIFYYLILTIISSIAANAFFRQPVSWGIRSLRNQIVCFILYFSIINAIDINILDRDDFTKIITVVGIIEIIIYLLQYLLIDKVTFTYIDTSEVRNGTSRLRFSYLLPLILSIKAFDNLLNGKNNKILNIVIIIFGASVLIVICKHRAPSVIYMVALVIGYLLWKKNIIKKFLIGFIVLILGGTIIFNSSLFQSTFNTLEGKNDDENTMDIRYEGQKYYINQLKKSIIFGYGNPNTNCKEAMIASGENDYYYLPDNGIIGFVYIYGLLGIVWVFILFYKIINASYFCYRKEKNLFFLVYFIFEIGNLYIGMHWYYYYTLPFILVLVLLNLKYCELKKKGKFNE